MKIYTRRGDQGQTDLFGGERVAKSDARVEAYGEVDELNACVGAAAAESQHADLRGLLQRVQSTLFDLGATLATPDPERREKANIPRASEADVAELEAAIDRLEGELPPLRSFILPGGSRASAAFHVARTVCRRRFYMIGFDGATGRSSSTRVIGDTRCIRPCREANA